MIHAFLGLFLCQLGGEALSRLTHLPIPGPVLGLVLMLGFLLWRGHVPEPLESASRGLLSNLSLLFVPAGTGIILHLHRVQEQWWPLTVAVVGSTVITIAVAGWTFQLIHRWQHPEESPQPDSTKDTAG